MPDIFREIMQNYVTTWQNYRPVMEAAIASTLLVTGPIFGAYLAVRVNEKEAQEARKRIEELKAWAQEGQNHDLEKRVDQ